MARACVIVGTTATSAAATCHWARVVQLPDPMGTIGSGSSAQAQVEGQTGAAAHALDVGEPAPVASLRGFVRERPLTAVLAAGACAMVGGVLFRRWARFAFIAAAAYVGTELWRREGRVDMRELAAKLSR